MVELTSEQRKTMQEQQQKLLDVQRQELEQRKADLENRGLLPTNQTQTYSRQPPRQPFNRQATMESIYKRLPPQVQQRLAQRTPAIPVRPTSPPVSQPMRDRSTSPQIPLPLQQQKKVGGR